MHYSFHVPAKPLGEVVHSFWDSSFSLAHARVRILPRGTIEVIINLSDDEIRIFDSSHAGRCLRLPGIVVSGAYAGALDIDPMQHASLIGVHFRPGRAFSVLGTDLSDLANNHFPLEALWGRAAVELRERLCAADSPVLRFRILEEVLTARLHGRQEHPAITLALGTFGPAGIGDSVRSVSQRLGLSQRRFIQVFAEQVGLTPKLFCRVLRFEQAREHLNRFAKVNLSQVALACGYCDQSHMVRDFQEFSGFSPTAFLRRPGDELVPNHVRLLG
jgi:AraC-like DNA-binding protein